MATDPADIDRVDLSRLIWVNLPVGHPHDPSLCLAAADAVLASFSRSNPCPECLEGELTDLGHRNPAADQVECNVCGFRS